MGQLVQHSSAKLAKVMIGVEVSPPHPIPRCHFPEDRVQRTGPGQGIAKPVQGGEQGANILAEIEGKRTTFALFNFRPGENPLHPWQWHLQR
jgi:hypothetical protein